jgi:hypothetical protein
MQIDFANAYSVNFCFFRPADMQAMFNALSNLNPDHGFPGGAKAFMFQEVIDLGTRKML